MNPAQLVGDFELLRTQRPGDGDLGVAKMRFDAVVAGQMDDFDLGKVSAELLGKPRRGVPELETVVENDHELHAEKFNHEGH